VNFSSIPPSNILLILSILLSAFYNPFNHHRKERKQYSMTFTNNNVNILHNPS